MDVGSFGITKFEKMVVVKRKFVRNFTYIIIDTP